MCSFREYLPFYQRNLRAAGPVVLTQLCAAIGGVIDTIMVGRYGTTDLAAVSLAHSIFITLMIFSMGSTMGITPLVGFAYVQHDDDRLRSLIRSGLRCEMLLIAAMMLILLVGLPLLPYLGQEPEVIACARTYYILNIVSVLPFLLFHFQKQVLEGLGNTTVSMTVAIIVNLINVPLNYMFIFGRWGAPELGATGAGIATLIVRILLPTVMFAIVLTHREWHKYLHQLHVSVDRMREIARVGLPIGAQQLMEILSFTLGAVLTGIISKEAVAAHQVANQTSVLTFMVSIGIGAATTIRVSHQYGAGRLSDMRMAAKASTHLALTWGCFCFVSLMLGRHLIPHLFTHDPEVIRLSAPLLVLCGLMQISDAMQCIGGAMLRGIADVRVPMWIAFFTYIVITLPLACVLMFVLGLGVSGLWIAFVVGLSLAAILLHSRFWRKVPR